MNKLYILFTLLIFANPSFGVSRFDPILKEIIKFQEFETESKNNMSTIHNELKPTIALDKKTLAQSQKNIEHYQDEINKLIDKIYNYLIELKNEKKSGDEFLYFLLKLRFDTIVNRAHDLEQTDLFDTTPPIDEDLYKEWDYLDIKLINNAKKLGIDIEKERNQTNALNNEIIKSNIKRYQFLINIIKKAFQFIPINELSKKTIKLLRASPSIWPILENTTFNFGHPDQSGGYIRIQTYTNHFHINIERAVQKIRSNIKCPLWEKQKKRHDLYWYESHFVPKKRIFKCHTLGAAENCKIILKLTDYDAGECDDLPYPDFLKDQTEQPFVELPNFFDTFNFNLFSDEIETPENATTQPAEQFIEPKNIGNNTDKLEQTDMLEEKSENIINNSEHEINNNIISNNIEDEISDDEYYLPPSGIRKFHNLMPETPYPALSLKKKDQKFVDRIFNSKTSHTISFGEFKSFWKKMNGQIIEETGSSHKQLIGLKNDALYGVSAHNDAHTYGKNTIKYFRAALYYIGCRPN